MRTFAPIKLLPLLFAACLLAEDKKIEEYDFLRPENVKQGGAEIPANVFRGTGEAAPIVIDQEPEDIDPRQVWTPEVNAIIKDGVRSILFPVVESEQAQVLIYEDYVRGGQFVVKKMGGIVQGDFEGKRIQLTEIRRHELVFMVSGTIGEAFYETDITVPLPPFFLQEVVVRSD
jgi:hypothetical protein